MARRRTPKLLTRTELALAMEMHPGTLTKWERDGCPVAKRAPRGRPSLFDRAAVEAWRDERDATLKASGLSLEAARARFAKAQAERVEMQNAVRRGELLELAEVVREGQDILLVVRARLLALPSSLAPELARETEPHTVQRRLTEAIHDALRELSRWRPGEDPR